MLEGDINVLVSKSVEDKIKQVTTHYQFAKLFRLTKLSEKSFGYIQRCFEMVVETQNFLELDFTFVAKILSSSGLHITSEVQVFDAVDDWINYNKQERSKFAENLLLKVRLTLLLGDDLNILLNKSSSFSGNEEFAARIKNILHKKKENVQQISPIWLKTRYCTQNRFGILICGGNDGNGDAVRNVSHFEGLNLNKVHFNTRMIYEKRFAKAVCLKGEVYVFSGYNNKQKWITSVEKYSPVKNTWNIITDMYDARRYFCVCAFRNEIFVIGGLQIYFDFRNTVLDSCLRLDMKNYEWKEVSRMNHVRHGAACAVFEERIVVSGGVENNFDKLNTVESYNVISRKWSAMPNMINKCSYHSLVAVRNKLFVIDSIIDTCEVFESCTNTFVALKLPLFTSRSYMQFISVDNTIIFFQERSYLAYLYDVDKDEWSEESCELTENLSKFCCVKMPWY